MTANKTIKTLLILCMYLCIDCTCTHAQTRVKKTLPKVGLCLSGGGAKGLAHIGLLKLIDSLGIKVDYITGTSMGSIVGGLYACGYSGNQIDSIVKTIDWNIILSENAPLDKINMDEKDEYSRYIAELAIEKKHVKFTGLIEGQTLLNLLTRLTRNVNHIKDFSQLPIPYRCMVVDIETMKSTVIDKGNLALAMRSSMSIPVIFKPVKINDHLYVDGGVISNFPVEEVQKMGADVVIGSYTGGRLLKKSEMNLFTKLLIQSSAYSGIQTAKEEIKRCHIFSNLTENMKEYEPGDFAKSDMIVAKGIELSYKILPDLVKLADELKVYNALEPKKNFQLDNGKLKIRHIYMDSLSSPYITNFIRKRIAIKKDEVIDFDRIANVINDVYATRLVQKVTYDLEKLADSTYNLRFNIEEENKWRFKSALHYDSELGAGFILNLTARNVLGKASRFFATVDLAQNFKVKAHYRKYLGVSPISFNVQGLFEQSLYKFTSLNGNVAEEYNNSFGQITAGFNANLSRNVGFYTGLIRETSNIYPRLEASYYIPEAFTSVRSVISGVQNRFSVNTLDHPFYPKKGVSFFVEHKMIFSGNERMAFQDTTEAGVRNLVQEVYDYHKIQANFKTLLPVNGKLSILINSDIGLTTSGRRYKQTVNDDVTNATTYEGFPILTDLYHIGGVTQRARINSIPFWGIKESEYSTANLATLQLGIQYELLHNLFITPSVSSLYLTDILDNDFLKNLPNMLFQTKEVKTNTNSFESSYAFGLHVTYRTPLGPVMINVSKESASQKVQGYLSIGYSF